MSYKNRKNKRSKLRRIKIYLSKFLVKFFYNFTRKEATMGSIYVTNVMADLRAKARIVRPNNLKISDWVEKYLTECFLQGRPVNILTQYCLSKALEKRFSEQGGKFVPTKKERKVLQEEIPFITSIFTKNGFRINWWITFNKSFVEEGLLAGSVEKEYKATVQRLVDSSTKENIMFADWEDDILLGKVKPDLFVLDNFYDFVAKGAFDKRLQELKMRKNEETGWQKTDEELGEYIRYGAACEANEAKLLSGENPIFGKEDFMMIPLESSERYDNFTVFFPDFKKRIVAVLTPYPWRLKI